MHGNVWEWCEDVHASKLPGGIDPLVSIEGSNRVIRGGSWFGRVSGCRSSCRLGRTTSYRDSYMGFRVAHDPQR